MVLLTELPPEIVSTVLSFVTPDDLASVSLVCRWLHNCIQHNVQLCRAVYYNCFDEPPTKNVDWEREVFDFLRLKSICASDDPNKKSQLPFVYDTVKRILDHATRITHSDKDMLFKHRIFRNAQLLSTMLNTKSNQLAFFYRSFLAERVRTPKPLPKPKEPLDLHQMSAELHCLLGAVLPTVYRDGDLLKQSYPYAASKVYDMRENSLQTLWGPFRADGSGRVDWEKLEAIMVVLRYNLRSKGLFKFPILSKYWNNVFVGSWPNSYMPMTREDSPLPSETSSLDLQDPYGVTGTWMRIVCFLDYSDFFRFNFPFRDDLPADMPRPPLDEGEELRLIIMKIYVTKIEPPGEKDHPDFPVVHFRGTSHSMDNPWDDNANSALRGWIFAGTCRTTKEGHIHWTTFSLFDDQPRWRSESIQVGGPKSGRGVIGNWFDTNYDPQGPCGPTAFWKLHEKKTAENSTGEPIAFSYLLAHSIGNGVNIVININQHFGNLGGGGLDDEDDEDDENDSDYEDAEDGEDDEASGGDGGGSEADEEPEDLEGGLEVTEIEEYVDESGESVPGTTASIAQFEIVPLLETLYQSAVGHHHHHHHHHLVDDDDDHSRDDAHDAGEASEGDGGA